MAPRPSPTPGGAAFDPTPNSRVVAIRANLMPDEVLVARRTEKLRRHVVVGLAATLGLLLALYALSWWQTSAAEDDREAAQAQSVALKDQQRTYKPLVDAQNTVSTVEAQLRRLMVGDLQWTDMLTTLRKQAGSDVEVTNVVGTISSGAAGAAGSNGNNGGGIGVLNNSGKPQTGTLTISGSAKDKRAVAAYVDRLEKVKGLATPYISNVTNDQTGDLLYTISVVVTTDALGGRYAAPAPVTTPSTTGGK